MKKLFIGLALPILTASATNITPYLLINKEYRSVSQEENATHKTGSSRGITDVDGFESRIGVKGGKDLKKGMKATAKIELGINSHRDGTSSDDDKERIRIRLAQADLHGNFGQITVGKHWNPNTLRMLSLDPFTATGAQLQGLESDDITAAQKGKFGLRARYFNNGFSYKTPSMHGLALSITADQNADDDLLRDADGATSKWTTALLTYDKKIGKMMLNAHATKAMGDVERDGSDLNPDQDFLTVGFKLSTKMWGLSAAMTQETAGQHTVEGDAADIERDYLMAALWYNIGATTIGFNYGKTEFDDNESVATGADSEGGEQSQMALGLIHKLSDNVKTRLIYKIQEIKANGDTDITNLGSTSNEAKSVIAGLTISL